jgi:hypothetical protein
LFDNLRDIPLLPRLPEVRETLAYVGPDQEFLLVAFVKGEKGTLVIGMKSGLVVGKDGAGDGGWDCGDGREGSGQCGGDGDESSEREHYDGR